LLLDPVERVIPKTPLPKVTEETPPDDMHFSVELLDVGDADPDVIQVWATPPLSPGISFIENSLRLITTFKWSDFDPAEGLDITDAYRDRLGTGIEGQKFGVGFVAVHESGGHSVRVTETSIFKE
jgi:hypothetical protein